MCDMNVSTHSFQYHSDTDNTDDELVLRYPKKSCFNKTVPRPKHYVAKSILKSTGKNIALSPLSNEKKKDHIVIEVAPNHNTKPTISLMPSYLSKVKRGNVSTLNKPHRIRHTNDNKRNGRVSPDGSDDESCDNYNNDYHYNSSTRSYSYDRFDAIFREQEDEHNEEMQQHLSQDEYYDWQREQQETKQSSWV